LAAGPTSGRSFASLLVFFLSIAVERRGFARNGAKPRRAAPSRGWGDTEEIEATLYQGGRGRAVGLYARLSARNHSSPSPQRSSCLQVGACRSLLLGSPSLRRDVPL